MQDKNVVRVALKMHVLSAPRTATHSAYSSQTVGETVSWSYVRC